MVWVLCVWAELTWAEWAGRRTNGSEAASGWRVKNISVLVGEGLLRIREVGLFDDLWDFRLFRCSLCQDAPEMPKVLATELLSRLFLLLGLIWLVSTFASFGGSRERAPEASGKSVLSVPRERDKIQLFLVEDGGKMCSGFS